MKIGRGGSSMRRSSPYWTDPFKASVMDSYANSVENFAPQMGIQAYNGSAISEEEYARNQQLEEQAQNTIKNLQDLGWDIKSGELIPERFKSFGQPIDKYEDLRQFLPEEMLDNVIAKDKARKEAEKILPDSASDKDIKIIADYIYKQHQSDYISGKDVPKENVFRQLEEDKQDMLAYKMLTDPYYRAAAFGWTDKNGNFQPGQLSLMTEAIDKQLEKQANDIPNDYFDSVIAMAPMSQFGINIMPTIRAMRGESPISADDYRVDAAAAFLKGRKEVRIQNYQGKIARGNEFISMADNVINSLNLQEQIEQYDNIINQYKNSGNLEKEYEALQQRNALKNQLNDLEKYKDLLGSYESLEFKLQTTDRTGNILDTGISARPRNITQKFQNLLDKIGASTDLGIHHYLTGYGKLLNELREIEREGYKNGIQDKVRAHEIRSNIINILNSYKNFINEKKVGWSESAKEETEDLKDLNTKNPASQMFQANVQLAQKTMNPADPRTILFAMPQQLGSSNSSVILSLGSMAVKAAAAWSGNPYAIAAAIPTGSQMNIANAAWENNAEVAEGYKRKVESALRRENLYKDVLNEIRARVDGAEDETPEELMRHVYNGEIEIKNLKANKVIADAVYGADLAFQYDMGETARSAYKESLIEIMPVSAMVKAGKFILRPLKPIANTIGKGVDITTHKLSDGVYNTINYSRKLMGKGEYIVNVDKMNKYLAGMASFASSIPKTILAGESYIRNLGGFALRSQLNMIGEGIEEGVQHVHQNRFANNKYDSSVNMGLFKPIAEDIVLGGRLGLEWLTGVDAGSGFVKDEQMFAEMRGGALGALFQSTPVAGVFQGSKLNSELHAIDIAVDNAIRQKLSQRDVIEKSKQFLKTMSDARYQDVINKLDKFAKLNQLQTEAAKARGTEEFGIAKEFLDETKKIYETAAAAYSDPRISKIYKQAGYKKGSPEYNERIAILVDQYMRLQDSKDELNAANEELSNADADLVTRQENDLTAKKALYILQNSQEDLNVEAQADVSEKFVQENAPLLSRLKAALDTIKQYEAIEQQQKQDGKTVNVSSIKKVAQKIVKQINRELGTNITNVEDFIETFGVADEESVAANRRQIAALAEFNQANETVIKLQGSPKFADKLVNMYNAAVKADEELQQRIHDAYVRSLEYDEQLEKDLEAQIELQERQEYQKAIDAQNARHTFIIENGEAVLKETNSRLDSEDYETAMQADDQAGSIYDAVDNSADTEAHREFATGMEDPYEQDMEQYTPISAHQSEQLFDKFIGLSTSDTPLYKLGRSLSKKAKSLTKKQLLQQKDRFGRNVAQKISLLYNNNYRFREFDGKYYAIKDGKAERLTRTEYLFARFLQDEFADSKIERVEAPDIEQAPSIVPSSPEPQPEPEPESYKPNEIQQKIRARLKLQAEQDKATLIKRNGSSYIFKEGDRYILYDRLHGIIGSQTIDKIREDNIQSWLEEIVEYENWSEFEDLEKQFNEVLANKYGLSSDTYKNRKLDLSVYKPFFNTEDKQRALIHISRLLGDYYVEWDDDLHDTIEEFHFIEGPWAMAGNIVDEIYRQVLGGTNVSYSDVLDINGETVVISDYVSSGAFDNIIEDIINFKDWLDKNQIVPVTDRILLHATMANGMRVAGETDMLGIDNNGNIILFDFKTSQYEFGDRYEKVRDGDVRSTKEQHSRQLTGYNMMIQAQFNNEFQVDHMFVVPIVLSYTSQNNILDTINNSSQKKLIDIPVNDALKSELSQTPPTIDEIREEFNQLESEIHEYGNKIRDAFENLADETRSYTYDFAEQLKKLKEDLEKEHPTDYDIKKLKQRVSELRDAFEKMQADVDNQIDLLIQAGVEFNKGRNKQDEEDKSLKEEQEGFEEDEDEFVPDPSDFGEEQFQPEEDDDWAQSAYDELLGKNEKKKKGKSRLDNLTPEEIAAGSSRNGRISGTLPDDNPVEGTVSGAYGAEPVQTKSKSISDPEAPDFLNMKPVPFKPVIKTAGEGMEGYTRADQRDVTGKLAEDSAEPLFSEKATFVIESTQLDTPLENNYGDEVGIDGEFIKTTIVWKGKKYNVNFEWATAIDPDTGDQVSKPLREKLRALHTANPKAKIVVTKISRTNGKFVFGDQKNILDSVFMTAGEEELLDILESGHLGFSSSKQEADGTWYSQIETLSRRSSAPLYPFRPGFSVVPGILTWIYKFQQAEKPAGMLNEVPIPLTPKRLDTKDIDLIVDILQSNIKRSAENNYRKVKVGDKEIKSPISDMQILQLLIRFGKQTRPYKTDVITQPTFVFDWVRDDGRVDNTRIEISGIGNDRGNTYVVDLTNEQEVEMLKGRLKASGFVYVNSENMLKYSLDDSIDNSNANPFKYIASTFKNNDDIKTISISPSLVFDRKDFDFREDGTWVPLTGAAWAIRHGWVTTGFVKLTNPRISIEDVDYADGKEIDIEEEAAKPENNTIEPENNPVIVDETISQPQSAENQAAIAEIDRSMDYDAFNTAFKIQRSAANNPIDIDRAVKRVKRMLGKHFKVNVIDGAVAVFEQGKAWAVGACKQDSIILSRLAEAGTEYHETFHRVMELLFSPSARRKLHQHYIKRYNNGQQLSEKETGERLADMFMSFINNLPDVYLSWNVRKMFDQIKDWVNAWREIDDFTLALTFFYAYSGLARFNRVSKASSENFDRIFGDAAYFTIDIKGTNVNFKNFANGTHLRDGIKYATFQILRGYKIDELGLNLRNLDITLSKIKTMPWYENLIGKDENNLALINKQMREVFDHWGSTQKLILDELERLSIGRKIDRNNKKDEDKQSGDLSVISQDIDGHYDGFYEFDRSLDLDTSLRIMLSTIPHLRYSTRDDLMWVTNKSGQFLDANGMVTTDPNKRVRRTIKTQDGKIVPVGTVDKLVNEVQRPDGTIERIRTTVPVSTNSLGVPEFMDFDTVYALLISAVRDSVDVADMINRLKVLGKDNPMFRTIAYNMYKWNLESIVKHKSGKEVAMIGDMQLSENDYIYTAPDERGERHIVYARDIDGHDAGEIIENAYILTNPDKESLVTRMFQAFKCQRMNFIFLFANREKDANGNYTDSFTYKNNKTNSTASTRIYPRQWFDNLRNGISGIFEVVGDTIKVVKGQENTIGNIAKEIRDFRQQMFKTNTQIITLHHNGKDYQLNRTLPEDLDFIETWFVRKLNMLGIDINKPMLDFYINQEYADFGDKADRFVQMLSSRSKTSSFNSFLDMLSSIQTAINENNINKILVDVQPNKKNKVPSGMFLFAENAFIKELASAYGSYMLTTSEFQTLGPEGVKMYTMAQNHTASDFTDDFNKAVVDKDGNVHGSPILDDMKKYCYNFFITKAGKQIGSIIIKHLHKPGHRLLSLDTFIGVKKVDDSKDGGTKYTKISKRDDYLAKVRILQSGGITFPTLSDKSTWFYLTGVRLPGLDYSDTDVQGKLIVFSGSTGRMAYGFDKVGHYGQNEVLDQMLEYAMCEREAVVRAINELEVLEENHKNETNPGKKLEAAKKIKNFHTNNQATRFAFILGIYTESENDPKYKYKQKEQFVSFNFNKKIKDGEYVAADLRDCLNQADKYFFGPDISDEKRRSLIANLLQHRLDEELQWAVNAGIIKKVNDTNVQYGQYRNVLLDANVIRNLTEKYKNYAPDGKHELGSYKDFTYGVLESWAICAYLNDINCKSIMSTEEVMRLYTGIPHFFKWKYGSDGVLTDLHGDLVKRLGGLGSTGDSNRLDLPNIARDYVCAEINDQLIESELYNAYKEGFIDNEYRITVFQQEIDKIGVRLSNMSEQERKEERKRIWDDIWSKDLDDVKKMADRRTKAIIEANAASETKSFESNINVADGTAFISPEMCLTLLRERGMYTGKVKQAFKQLMGMDAGSDMLSNHDAYRIIFDALISTQKYSAYGYRMEGEIPVHFYDKFALFPIFESIAYGFTRDMFLKMKEDGVDMLMFESAVKVGSQGSQEFNPDTFRRSEDKEDEQNWNHDADGKRTEMKPNIKDFHFNTYKQQYKFIRRQLNTDPREEERMHIGTQMLKIALANLFKEAVYKTRYGEKSGEDLRDDIMECMRELADIGLSELDKQLRTDGEIDIKKLSTFLKDELSKRDADEDTIASLDVVLNKDTGKYEFSTPLEAMPNIEWIESIIISHINHEVIDINLPGNAYYQRTPFGMEGSPIRIVSDEALDKIEDKSKLSQMLAKAKKQFMIYSGRTLKAINNNGSMDCIISIDYFMNQTDLIPKEYRNNYWAARNWLKRNGIIGKNADPIMIGYRIPTQAESSVHALRVVDVLPVVRDTIVLPKDFTKITGSDFDIDKLYLTSYNFKRTDSGITRDFEEGSSKYWQNRLLDNYMALLQDGGRVEQDENGNLTYHKGRTMQFLHRSIDNDTSLMRGDKNKSVYERIVGNVENKHAEPFGYQSLSTQVDIKLQYLGGKFNIGPFALANNAQILTMLYDVEFTDDPNSIIHALGATSLHNRTDKNGNSILAWISAMINGAVDAAKDPWQSQLNVNSYTYGTINMLLRTGMGDQTFMFINQPILRAAAEAFEMEDGVIIEDSGKTKTTRQNEAIEKMAKNYFVSLGTKYNLLLDTILSNGSIGDTNKLPQIRSHIIQVAKQLFGADGNAYTNKFYKWDVRNAKPENDATEGHSILEDVITNPDVRIDPDKPVSLDNLSTVPYYALQIDGEWVEFSAKEIQLYVLGAMQLLKPYVSALEDVVKYTKIDTKKHGINWMEQQDYKDNYLNLFVDEEDENSIFTTSLNNMLRDSFIDKKTIGSIDYLDDILVDNAVQYKEGFRMAVRSVQDIIHNYGKDARVSIYRMLLGGIKNDFIQDYAQKNNINTKNLFVGINSIANRLTRLKIAMRNDSAGKYQNYAAGGVITDPLFAALETVPYMRSANEPMFVKMNKSMLDDPQVALDIKKSWRFALKSEDAEIKKFAEDLIIYAYLTSNDTAGFTKFAKFVPREWKQSSGFNAHMTKYKNMPDLALSSALEERVPTWLKQHWFDNNLVPIQNYVDYTSSNGVKFTGHKMQTDDDDLRRSNILSIMGAIFFKQNQDGFSGYWVNSIKDDSAPLYIKVRRRNIDSYSKDKLLLYELIGHGVKKVGGSKPKQIKYPIYRLITPPGAFVNTSSNNYFYIYTNDTFEHVIDPIVIDDIIEFNKKADEVSTWMQNHPGKIYPEAELASLAKQYSAGYRNLIVETANYYDIIGTVSDTSVDRNEVGVQKIISGGQTGVDTIGLRIARKLGIITGGTAPKGYLRESDIDNEDISSYSLAEITDEEQQNYTSRTGKKDPYTGRTELNVKNSDGTVYFHYSGDKTGLYATQRSAKEFNKPFLLNPTAEQLSEWINKNDIKVLNVAGNRGSKLTNAQAKQVEDVLTQALNNIKSDEAEREGKKIKDICKNQG